MTYLPPIRLFLSGLLISTAHTALAQDAEHFDEIIVTGSPLGRSIDEAITGHSVLSGGELQDRLAATIGETLKSEPGVSSTYFGAGASRPIIRGQGGDRVRVLMNGIGSIDASSASPDHAVAAEPAQAERIEVMRGASVLRYGSSGSGGIVNIIDGRIPSKISNDGLNTAVRLGVSSADSGREIAASTDQAISENFLLHIDGTVKDSKNFKSPIGTILNSAAKTSSITGGASYIGKRGFIGGAYHKFTSDYEVSSNPDEMVSISLEQARYDINGALEMDGIIEKMQIFGGYADYSHTEFEEPQVIGTVFTNKGYEVRIEAIQRERKNWSAAYGLHIRKRDFAAFGEEAFVAPTITRQFGAYMFHQIKTGDIHLEGASRFEINRQEDLTSRQDKEFNLISLSGGGDIHITNSLRIGGAVFRTERAPTTEELFSNGPHLATSQFVHGDAALGKETASGIETTLRYRRNDHYITANLFHTGYKDFIFESETADIEDELPVFQITAEDASYNGFELQMGSNIGMVGTFNIKLDALAEYVRAKTDSANLPRIPPLSILAGIEGSSDKFSLRGELDYTSKPDHLALREAPTNNYLLANLFASWTAPLATKKS